MLTKKFPNLQKLVLIIMHVIKPRILNFDLQVLEEVTCKELITTVS